ncbi:cell wall hydrolase [Paenibacillus sp. MER 99-2]|uniref:cell wall hydrolase n=1 Tax=Paenibacillus sp. MER 99-2 TaxID=2939572 RepID=UPI00203A76A9|nr:cell wall hydrolase [Paenibacillus sp. MER 99-2]MCM3174587.1 cell wall hydrolase [Paenibacillus sp. MER 99-2]
MAIGDALTSKSQLNGRDSVDLLARTLYGEARGDSESRVGVAYVIINRKNDTTQNPFKSLKTIEDVVLYPNAFSCFLTSDPNFKHVLAPDTSSAAWKNCVSLASNVTAHKNPIGDKLYYTATSLFNNLSYTENGKLYYKMPGTGTFQVSSKIAIGGHMFFNIIP